MRRSALLLLATASVLASVTPPAQAFDAHPAPIFAGATRDALALGTHVVLPWNDLGMHCMNRSHANLSVWSGRAQCASARRRVLHPLAAGGGAGSHTGHGPAVAESI
jgi:hypothetical protein